MNYKKSRSAAPSNRNYGSIVPSKVKTSEIMTKPKKFLPLNIFLPSVRDSLNDYICSLCQGVFYKPKIDKCGHIFCKSCILYEIHNHRVCPVTKLPLSEADLNEIEAVNSHVMKREIYCKNKGCKWKGRLYDFEDHDLNKCELAMVDCKYTKCLEKIHRFRKEIHEESCKFRPWKCSKCLVETIIDVAPHHYTVCPKMIIPCVNNCDEMMERESKNSHDLICPMKKCACPFSAVSCSFIESRNKLNEHILNEINPHFELLYNKTQSILEKLINLWEQVEKGKKPVDEIIQIANQTKKINTVRLGDDSQNESSSSDTSETHSSIAKMLQSKD